MSKRNIKYNVTELPEEFINENPEYQDLEKQYKEDLKILGLNKCESGNQAFEVFLDNFSKSNDLDYISTSVRVMRQITIEI